nr:hypothetical protein SEVIR_9G332500v2 [Setaria viridis]TKV94991.1 hypothetical protein SEVIR_9G332500v2 [Setaria viridis]
MQNTKLQLPTTSHPAAPSPSIFSAQIKPLPSYLPQFSQWRAAACWSAGSRCGASGRLHGPVSPD